MIKEGTATSSVTVDSASQERLADADELEAALIHVTRPSAQMYLRSLITNLRKEGESVPSTSEDSASPTVQSTLAATGSPKDSATPLPASATNRVATPPKEITPFTEPTITISPITRCPITPANKNQIYSAQHESPEDDSNALIYEDSQHRKRDREREMATSAVGDANEKENALIAPLLENEGQGTQDKAREQSAFIIDLSDVPPQPPIPKSAGFIKEGASKYAGVTFHKPSKKWIAQIMIDGKKRRIGKYDNEEKAAVDYARATFKYRSEDNKAKAPPKQKQRSLLVDLNDVPPQPPISKVGRIKEGGSKYKGVTFHKLTKKWVAQITIDEKIRRIGSYNNEEEAAVDYARAVFKYRTEENKSKPRKQSSFLADLSDVRPRPPILRSAGHTKEGASKYAGVNFDERRKKWRAQITIDGKPRYIGYYADEEEAANDYARAAFKYKCKEKQAKAPPKQKQRSLLVDLSDVPPQPPILKEGTIKEGGSKYKGVTFHKRTKKWVAQITIDEKIRRIGSYNNEEEAAVDYARAVFKYRTEANKSKPRKQSSFLADLSDVPPQPPIFRSAGRIKEGASKYAGTTYEKRTKKWIANIVIDGKRRYIGAYDDEVEAAVDYARATFKYKCSNYARARAALIYINEKNAETEKTQHVPETAKRKRPPCAEDEEKADASKRPKNSEKDNCNHMQAIKLEEDCCW